VTIFSPIQLLVRALRFSRTLATIGLLVLIVGTTSARAEFDPTQHDLENIIYLELKSGRVVIKTYPKEAPGHVARIKELVRQGFYNGLKWHRVLPEFMAQTGDPRGDGSGGSGQNLKAEFNDRHHLRGTVSMARSSEEDSADSQFFIMLLPKFALDGQYTVWGRVIDGMSNVEAIKKGSSGFNDGEVINPDKIVTMSVAADVEKNLPRTPRNSPAQPIILPGNKAPSPSNGNGGAAPSSRNINPSPYYTDNPGHSAPNPPTWSKTVENAPAKQQTSAPQTPLPEWPIEPPDYDTVFPPIPEGGYTPY